MFVRSCIPYLITSSRRGEQRNKRQITFNSEREFSMFCSCGHKNQRNRDLNRCCCVFLRVTNYADSPLCGWVACVKWKGVLCIAACHRAVPVSHNHFVVSHYTAHVFRFEPNHQYVFFFRDSICTKCVSIFYFDAIDIIVIVKRREQRQT